MQYFYSQEITGTRIIVRDDEFVHLSKSLRKKTGDHVNILDGLGNSYQCSILASKKNFAELQILESKSYDRNRPKLEIAIAPTKNLSRFEWFLEKATEIGVDSIIPIITHHSERKNIRMDRCQRIITSAGKQSKQFYFPIIRELTDFQSYISDTAHSTRLLAYVAEAAKQKSLVEHMEKNKTDASICIGPEGGFDATEAQAAISAGFQMCNLGESRLRTETAGVYAASILRALL